MEKRFGVELSPPQIGSDVLVLGTCTVSSLDLRLLLQIRGR